MASYHHGRSSAQALYRIYIQPLLSSPHRAQHPFTSILSPQVQPRSRSSRQLNLSRQRQLFSTSTPKHYAQKRAPEVRTQKYDDEITARKIYLVDNSTGKLDPTIRNLPDVRSQVNRQTHRLVQVTPADHEAKGEIPVCRIINKQEAYEAGRRRKAAAKETKRMSGVAASVKTLEINWAIDGNDLGHRLGKMAQFLDEGRKVEVVLARKKGGRRATVEECQDVIQRIRRAADDVAGAREVGMEGEAGAVCRLFLQGTPAKATVQQMRSEERNTEAISSTSEKGSSMTA